MYRAISSKTVPSSPGSESSRSRSKPSETSSEKINTCLFINSSLEQIPLPNYADASMH